MILALHITIALISIIASSAAFLAPSLITLRISYGLIVLTLVSGSYLIATSPAHMVQACISGVIYVAAATTAVFFARRKFSRMQAR